MAGFDNDTVYGTGLDLSGNATVANKLNVDGYLYFGNSAGNPGAGLLTSTNDTLVYTGGNGSGRIENRRWHTAFVVDASSSEGSRGTYTTIQAAIDAASSGDIIFVRPGTYTEDLTLKAGVNIYAVSGGENNGNVIIVGKLDGSSGTCVLANLRLQTNSDVIYDVTGSTLNQTAFINCWFTLEDGDGITLNNANANPVFIECKFRQTGSDFDLYNITSCETITFQYCDLTNSGAVVGVSNIASGIARFRYSRMQPHRFTTSGSGEINAHHSAFICNTDNLTPITTAGTGTNQISQCRFESGTAASISAGSGTTVQVTNSSVRSTNANPITGAGTVVYSGIDFINTGNGINSTTQTPRYTQQGKYRALGQPSFLARPSGSKLNVTGAGTVYTVVFDDEVFDQNSNFDGTSTFTAPVTGKYQFSTGLHQENIDSTASDLKVRLVTSNHTYMFDENNPPTETNYCSGGSILVDMDAGDTATVSYQVSGMAGDTVDIIDDGNGGSFFSGILLA